MSSCLGSTHRKWDSHSGDIKDICSARQGAQTKKESEYKRMQEAGANNVQLALMSDALDLHRMQWMVGMYPDPDGFVTPGSSYLEVSRIQKG